MNIFQLLDLEWFKFRKNKLFIVAFILILLLPIGIIEIVSSFSADPPMPTGTFFLGDPIIWKTMGYAMNWTAFLIIGFLSIYSIAYENEQRLHKQSIINGQPRAQYLIGKLVYFTLVSVIFTTYYLILVQVYGKIYNEGFLSMNFQSIIGVFMMTMSYSILGMTFGSIFKRVGLGVILFMVYGLFLENIIRIIHSQVFLHKSMQYYPINATEDLASIPIPESMKEIAKNNDMGDVPMFLSFGESMTVTVIYTLIFVGVMYFLMTRKDL